MGAISRSGDVRRAVDNQPGRINGQSVRPKIVLPAFAERWMSTPDEPLAGMKQPHRTSVIYSDKLDADSTR